MGEISQNAFVSYENERKREIAMDTLNKNRFKWSLILGGSSYLASSYTLYNSWYKDYPQSSFHLYNDWGEWKNMDKAGHIWSSYVQASAVFKLSRWIGFGHSKSTLYGVLAGGLFQSTIEVMDGFSSQWGFSIPDFAANVLGLGLFAGQEALWRDQKIKLKFSYFPKNYSQYGDDNFRVVLPNDIYGDNFQQQVLKDYNAQTVWVSGNVHGFNGPSFLPKWLNVAIGVGAENLFGGYDNSRALICSETGCAEPVNVLPRYGQFFLSLDADLSKLHTESPFLNTLLDVLNILKVPFSTIEINTQGEIKFHLIYF